MIELQGIPSANLAVASCWQGQQQCLIPVLSAVPEVLQQDLQPWEGALAFLAVELLPLVTGPGDGVFCIAPRICTHVS